MGTFTLERKVTAKKMQDQILEMMIRIKFCLTNGEGGEKVGAKSV